MILNMPIGIYFGPLQYIVNNHQHFIKNYYLPSPETNRELRKRSSPALKVVTQSPDSKFIKFTYIRLRDRHTKCF